MAPFSKVINSFGLVCEVALAALLTMSPPVAADPGDLAAGQKRYLAIQAGAKQLQKVHEILERADDKFKGHRGAAMRYVKEALTQLDEAVRFADLTDKPGQRTTSTFEADRGRLAATQTKYPTIKESANKVIEAGKFLDQGFDKFGGHRVKALKALNNALDELTLAAKEGK